MLPSPRRVQRVYYALVLGNTLAASFIWGINTLFLLDAGLTNFEAFGANAFYTVGVLLFEIPTGVVADTMGRRWSYVLGSATLAVTTALYEEASRIVVSEAADIWIYNTIELRGLSNRLQGFKFTPVGSGALFRVLSVSS